MKILTEGHKYSLDNFTEVGVPGQTLQFIEKKKVEDELITVNDGTTNEEVLKVLINRLQYLYYKLPSTETYRAIGSLGYALKELESRTNDS